MKPYIALGAILLVILNGLLLLPATGGHTVPIAGLALALAILVLVFAVIGGKQGAPTQSRPGYNACSRASPDPASGAHHQTG